jgi:hypothetical protein
MFFSLRPIGSPIGGFIPRATKVSFNSETIIDTLGYEWSHDMGIMNGVPKGNHGKRGIPESWTSEVTRTNKDPRAIP